MANGTSHDGNGSNDCGAPSVPLGAYATYRQAAEHFLGWLLLARSQILRDASSSNSTSVTLDALQSIVDQLATAAAAPVLTPQLQRTMPAALEACQNAIALHKRVARFYPSASSNAELQRHNRLLHLLQTWYAQLKPVCSCISSSNASGDATVECTDWFSIPDAIAAHDALYADAFAHDRIVETLSYVLDLEDLAEGVYTVYAQVKTEAKTLVEATAVVHVAMACATAATAQLQERFPSIETADDLLSVLTDALPHDLDATLRASLSKFHARAPIDGYTFTPGVFLAEVVSVTTTLHAFAASLPRDSRSAMPLPDKAMDATTPPLPQNILPDLETPSPFLLQQLPLLYNALLDMIERGRVHDPNTLAGAFTSLLRTFFMTKAVTLPLVFAVVCWTKSVGCLQGNGDVGKHVSWTISQTWKLLDHLDLTLPKRFANSSDRSLNLKLTALRLELVHATKSTLLVRENPVLAGSVMLDYQFKYLELAIGTPSMLRRLCAFGHLYAALLDCELLDNISLLDELLALHSATIFSPSRAAAVHGSFVQALTASLAALPAQQTYSIRDVSSTYRLLVEKDTRVLGQSVSSRQHMLADVSAMCSTELFAATRVLSRDLLAIDDAFLQVEALIVDVTKAVVTARGGRVQGSIHDDIAAMLLVALDALNKDTGNVDDDVKLPVRGFAPGITTVAGLLMCSKASNALDDAFLEPTLGPFATYYLVPTTPDVVTQEFGATSVAGRGNELAAFEGVMRILEARHEPVSAKDIVQIKRRIKNHPSVLAVVTPYAVTKDSAAGADVPTTLGSLLHQAAAGRGHNIRLVEWMIHMGALEHEAALHSRRNDSTSTVSQRAELPDQMAVHSAAIAGHTAIVQLLLEANHLRDLNTRTSRGKESLLMLAVKHGHRKLFDLLVSLGAKVDGVDANGKRLVDMTRNTDWQRTIRALTSEQTRARERLVPPTNLPSASTVRSSTASPIPTLSTQQSLSNASSLASTTAPTSKKSKKNKKKKKAKKTAEASSSDLSATLSSPLDASSVSHSRDAHPPPDQLLTGDQIANVPTDSTTLSADALVALMAQLNTATVVTDAMHDDVHRACESVVRLMNTVRVYAKPDHIHPTSSLMRAGVVSSALKVIHAMQKFHRRDHRAAVVAALAPLKQLCATTFELIFFVLETAQLMGSIDRPGQARELLELLEARLLAIKSHRPFGFLGAARKLGDLRIELGFEPAPAIEALFTSEEVMDDMFETMRLDMAKEKAEEEAAAVRVVRAASEDISGKPTEAACG